MFILHKIDTIRFLFQSDSFGTLNLALDIIHWSIQAPGTENYKPALVSMLTNTMTPTALQHLKVIVVL
jgi:hypothetical protein